MYSSTSTDYQKFPKPSAPPPPPAAGIPVSNMPELQAHPIRVASHQTVPWSTGLCGCCSDMGNCCITCWCPCITFGQIAEIVDKGTTSCVMSGVIYTLVMCVLGCSCCYSCFYRKKMRQQYALQESPCGDCLVHLFCESCSLCQEYRELKNRGFDMSLGWHGNVEKQNKGMAMAPVVEAGMIR